MRGKKLYKPEFVYNNFRIISLTIYTNLIEYNNFCDTKAPLLRCFPLVPKLDAGDSITTGQYMKHQTFSNTQFRPLLKYVFVLFPFSWETRVMKKHHFLSLGTTRLVFMFKRASINQFQRKRSFTMVVLMQIRILFYMGTRRQRGRGCGALAQVHGRTAFPVEVSKSAQL